MLLNNIKLLLVGALGTVSYVSAAANVAQAVSDMDSMSNKMAAAKASLDNYKGGITGAFSVARSITVAQTSARTARENLEANDQMTPEESSRYFVNYEHMSPILLGAIHSAQEKAPLFKKSGLGPEARTYLSNLHREKRLFEGVAKAKIPGETFSKFQPSADEISRAFDDADRAFQ